MGKKAGQDVVFILNTHLSLSSSSPSCLSSPDGRLNVITQRPACLSSAKVGELGVFDRGIHWVLESQGKEETFILPGTKVIRFSGIKLSFNTD